MPREKGLVEKKVEKVDKSESIIYTTYSNFTSLVSESYHPRFSESQKAQISRIVEEELLTPASK